MTETNHPTVKAWFVWERHFGKWNPTLYYEKPSYGGANGSSVRHGPLHEVMVVERGGAPVWKQITILFPPPEDEGTVG